MYKYHRRYISTVVLNEKPNITAKQLSLELGIPLGEAFVILHELKTEQKAKQQGQTEETEYSERT